MTSDGRDPVPADVRVYPMAPLIRGTLLLLYLALVLPLPVLAPAALRPWMDAAVPLGVLLVMAATSERVSLDAGGVSVGSPSWAAWWPRAGWSLSWEAVAGLTPVGTSQGGRVYYVRSRGGGPARLLPQRIARFEEFLDRFSRMSGLSTQGIGRLTPPWTYRILAVISGVLLLGELIVGALAFTGAWPEAQLALAG
jgi:hypothetical protein